MTRKPYENTEVPVSRSQDELRRHLSRFGAEQFSFGEGRDWAGVEFVHANKLVRLRCPVRPGDVGAVRSHLSNEEKRIRADEAERARVWRVLVHSVKARLVAVEEGLETFEQAFLSHLVDPSSNRTVWEAMGEIVASRRFELGGSGLRPELSP